ncbi:hypothetical protein QL093DRAFT_1235233 [Fusarium oxysporum]|nr:hypothetical protein QL093DRAFT_1235233 [Fusarium oxysporum]
MHILLPTLQRRHNHPNTDQDLSGKSHRLCYYARSPSRPNLEAPILPSSILSPQASCPLCFIRCPRPKKRQTAPTLNLPILYSRGPLHHLLGGSSDHPAVSQLLTGFETNSISIFLPSLSF